MNKQTILKKLAAFTANTKNAPTGTNREVLRYLYFTGHEVVATDTHWLAILKDELTENPHYEDANGDKVNPPNPYPDYRRILIPRDQIGWEYVFPEEADILQRLKHLFTGMASAVKDTSFNKRPSILVHKSENLELFSACKELQIHTQLLSGLTDPFTFEGYYFLSYLIKAFDFLGAAGGGKVRLYVPERVVPKAGPLLTLETPRALVLGGPVGMERVTINPVQDFVKQLDKPAQDNKQADTDLDFLD